MKRFLLLLFWMFVKDDYPRFNVMEAKSRSLIWFPLAKGNRNVISRIGRLKFWRGWLEENGLVL